MSGVPCALCPRGCGADRTESAGYCGAGETAYVAKVMLHFGEEPCLAGSGGSGAVFFAGCSLRCVYCQNEEISRNAKRGNPYTPAELAEIFRTLERRGAENIDLVTPTHFVPQIIEALKRYRPGVPVVYNSSGYEKQKTLRMLEDFADVYLLDFKYIDPSLAAAYSAAPDYPDAAKAAVAECLRQKPEPVFKGDRLVSGVLIRHLLLPSATENAIAVCRWVAEHAPGAMFSLLRQYTPCGTDLPPALRRRVTKREYEKVVQAMETFGMTDAYIQEPGCACTDFIPDWDAED